MFARDLLLYCSYLHLYSSGGSRNLQGRGPWWRISIERKRGYECETFQPPWFAGNQTLQDKFVLQFYFYHVCPPFPLKASLSPKVDKQRSVHFHHQCSFSCSSHHSEVGPGYLEGKTLSTLNLPNSTTSLVCFKKSAPVFLFFFFFCFLFSPFDSVTSLRFHRFRWARPMVPSRNAFLQFKISSRLGRWSTVQQAVGAPSPLSWRRRVGRT